MTDASEIPYVDEFDAANERLRRALELLTSHAIPPSPIHYRLGYEAVSGQHAQLRADFEQILAARPQPDFEALWTLYKRWFLQDETSLESLRQELKRVLADAQAHFQGSDAQFGAYTETLGHFVRRLDSERLSAAELAGEVRDIIGETRKFESVQREAHSRMGALMQEVEVLRHELSQAREEAMTDGLTQIANRKAFERSLEESVGRACATNAPLTLMMIDIDHFKKFNDTYGHPVGDKVLRFVAAAIKNTLKNHGLVARYGGEEFAVLIPDMSELQVERLAQDMLIAVSSGELRDRKVNQTYGRITISIGLSRYGSTDDGHALLERADTALYGAKQAGRNCIKRVA